MKFRFSLIYAIAVLFMLSLTGCARNEFSIEASMDASVTGTFQLTYYTSSKKQGWITETSLAVTSGKGKIRCITRYPTMVWVGSSGFGAQPMAFYAERGDKIVIEGNESDPLTWEISGNNLDEEWSDWRLANLAALRSRDAAKVNAAVAKYVKGHKDSELSVALMLTTYNRAEDEEGYRRLWNSIDPDAKKEKLLNAIGRADQFTSAPVDAPARVGDVRLHAVGETIMTVAPRLNDATLLYFEQGDEAERKADIDSLRALLKAPRDGRRLLIADVALAQDSMSWLNRVRQDSTDNPAWLNAWAPGGRMHSSIAIFSVPATPWFVVVDPKGNQKYRGRARDEALKAARLLLKRAPARKSPQKPQRPRQPQQKEEEKKK